MNDGPEVAVLRLGHRPGRDERMTTHVGLTARALGADRVLLAGRAAEAKETVDDVTDRFGGPFSAELVDSAKALVRDWEGTVVHLTMYGLPVQDVVGEITDARSADDRLLVVVGAEKVSFDVYEAADHNVGVTNQPHSEVAALAVFLDRLFDGRELDREWIGAERRVVPEASGKTVVSAGPDDDQSARSTGADDGRTEVSTDDGRTEPSTDDGPRS